MSKFCPNCGKQVPDESKFCLDCGYNFEKKNSVSSPKDDSGLFSNGKIFLIIIVIVLIIGAAVIFSSGGENNQTKDADDIEHVKMTITEVNGYSSDGTKPSYTVYTYAFFNQVPDDLNGYMIKTSYYDDNDTRIGYETDSLSSVYYDSDYAISFGHYTSYKKINPDHVKVEIIYDDKVVDSFTEDIDKNKLNFS